MKLFLTNLKAKVSLWGHAAFRRSEVFTIRKNYYCFWGAIYHDGFATTSHSCTLSWQGLQRDGRGLQENCFLCKLNGQYCIVAMHPSEVAPRPGKHIQYHSMPSSSNNYISVMGCLFRLSFTFCFGFHYFTSAFINICILPALDHEILRCPHKSCYLLHDHAQILFVTRNFGVIVFELIFLYSY